jgi:chemotaxis protein MotB
VIALKQRIALLEQQAGDCSTPGEPPVIYTDLKQVFSDSPVQVERQGALVRVTLPADLLFTSDGLHLREEAIFSLDLLATALKLHPVTTTVIGYTDSLSPPQSARKSWPTAWEWTAAQAALVVRALQDRFGVPPARLELIGRGSTSLPGNEDTPEGRALNRRIVVEIRSIPSIQ